MRVVFHERGDAEAVLARLLRDGFEGVLARERFAGEDDDEDHAWVVVTDAPEVVVEVLAEGHDGWVDHDVPEPPTSAIELPDGPRRVRAHFTH